MLPLIAPKFPQEVIKAFTPVSLSGEIQHALIVKQTIPAKSVKELIAYMKANRGKLSFGSAGVGTIAHVAGERLSRDTGTGMLHVPYPSDAAAMTELLGGNLDLNFQTIPALRPYLDSPGFRILAVLSAQRVRDFPQLPTMVESGFADFVLTSWMGLFAPGGLPAAILDRLSAALKKSGKNPALQQRLRNAGINPVGSDTASFEKMLAGETRKWKAFVERTEAKLNP